jgi:hypothetical protein
MQHTPYTDVAIFWDIGPGRLHVNRHVGGPDYLPLQGRKVADQKARVKQAARH